MNIFTSNKDSADTICSSFQVHTKSSIKYFHWLLSKFFNFSCFIHYSIHHIIIISFIIQIIILHFHHYIFFLKYSNSITQICHLRSHSRIILHIYLHLDGNILLYKSSVTHIMEFIFNSSRCYFIRLFRFLMLCKTLTQLIEFQFRFYITIVMNLSGKVLEVLSWK